MPKATCPETPQICEVRKASGASKKLKLVEGVVDSGAEESVTNKGVFPGKVLPSAMSKAGRRYRAANGSRIPNLGQQDVEFRTDEGFGCGIPFQVAEVERPLKAASQLAACGNKVVFEKSGGYVENMATGKNIALKKKGGVYVLRMWVAASDEEASGFTRPGR